MVSRSTPLPGTPEREVIRLLTEQDGWTWQGHIEVELDHPIPQIQHLLTQMEDEGRIVRREVGRSQLVVLPGMEPDYLAEFD